MLKQRLCGNLGEHAHWTLDCYPLWDPRQTWDYVDVYVSPDGDDIDWTLWGMGWSF